MLLTITTTHQPATDLGYLLHKHPGKVQSFDLSFGRAHVFYPEATEARCTAAVLLDVDPVALVRGRQGPSGDGRALEQYVNDRPYVASSFMSVALAQVFGSALGGRSQSRAELANAAIPLEATLAALPCRGGEELLRRLFEPLGYEVEAEGAPLDETFPEWGASPCLRVTLRAERPLKELLNHLYVLIPVLDNEKHYWVERAELEKLLRKGEGWLAGHPERTQIVQRYLKHKRGLAREALARLSGEGEADPDEAAKAHAREEEAVEQPLNLNDQRLAAVTRALREAGARRVLDLGCGEGRLIRHLIKERQFEEIVGMDVAHRALEIAEERLRLENLPPHQKGRVRLLHGSLMYRDRRLAGFDAAAVVEVIEHLDPPRLAALERVVFEFARPRTVVLTTPNIEYNVNFATLAAGRLRHRDHRFEWTRAEFEAWARGVGGRFGYDVAFGAIGPVDAATGAPTQMGVFTIQ